LFLVHRLRALVVRFLVVQALPKLLPVELRGIHGVLKSVVAVPHKQRRVEFRVVVIAALDGRQYVAEDAHDLFSDFQPFGDRPPVDPLDDVCQVCGVKGLRLLEHVLLPKLEIHADLRFDLPPCFRLLI
jgi:hypothetical protein